MVFADKSKLKVSKTSEEHCFTEMFTYIGSKTTVAWLRRPEDDYKEISVTFLLPKVNI